MCRNSFENLRSIYYKKKTGRSIPLNSLWKTFNIGADEEKLAKVKRAFRKRVIHLRLQLLAVKLCSCIFKGVFATFNCQGTSRLTG